MRELSAVVNFAEESCWSGDQFRSERKSVMFTVTSVGKIDGKRVNSVISADYGVFYDPSDEYILALLTRDCPGINWDRLVYWKSLEKGEIVIEDPDKDRTVGHVKLRRGASGHEPDMTNVVRLSDWGKRDDDQ